MKEKSLLVNLSLDSLSKVEESYQQLLASAFLNEKMLWKTEEEYTKFSVEGFPACWFWSLDSDASAVGRNEINR